MKKLFSILPALIIAMTTLTLTTACDDDSHIAYTLEGTWRGDMRIRSDYGGRSYYATDTEITFLRDPSYWASGDGYWVDYYSGAPWDYVANHIEWTVSGGEIRVYFREQRTSLYIRDYRLDSNRFVGTLWDNGQRVDFTLYHTSSPNYGSYNHWGYDGWNSYWSRPATRSDSDSTTVDRPVMKIGDREY